MYIRIITRTMVDKETIQLWLDEVIRHIRESQSEIDRLRSEISADKRREAALRALLSADSAENQPEENSVLPAKEENTSPLNPMKHPIERGALAILKERGQPIHITDLRSELIARGIPIPGKGTDANVIIYLARAPEVCRIGRGLYALKEWSIPQVPPRRRRSKRKKRKARAH